MLLRCHLALFDDEGAETLSSPGHVHRRAGRSRADHESNELSRKQLWLPSSALLLFGCSQRQNAAAAHGRERESREEGEMGRTTTEGRINSAAVWSTDRSREQEKGRKAKFGPSLLLLPHNSLPASPEPLRFLVAPSPSAWGDALYDVRQT